MSGVTGASRIKSRADYDKFVSNYCKLLRQFSGIMGINSSGSYNSDLNKQDFGDIDLVVHINSTKDKPTLKKDLVSFFNNISSDIIVPFTSIKHLGRRSYNSGEIVTVCYYDAQLGYSVQIDNIIALTNVEAIFKQQFLNMPAPVQGLVLGLVKIAVIEQDAAILFEKLKIKTDLHLELNQEFEFNLSSVGLQLRKVTYEIGSYKQSCRALVWSSNNYSDLQLILFQYNLNADFDSLLQQVNNTIKNIRSPSRIQGVFASMITVKSGEIGTAKGNGKLKSLDKIKCMLGN